MGVRKRTRKQKDGSYNTYWYIRYWLNGEEKKESVGKVGEVTKATANARLEERKRQIRLGQTDSIGVKIPILQDFSESYISYVRDVKQNRSWKCAVQYLGHLKRTFAEKKLSQITVKDIDNYKLLRLQRVKPSTVNRELACLSHLFNYAKRQKVFFGENPVSISKLLPENNIIERILSIEEEQRLLECSSQELRAIVICALNTGMRKGEILTLRWNNINHENNIITLEHTNTKSKKTRRIPINSNLRTLLKEQKLKGGGSDHIFLNSKGTPYKRHDSIKQAFTGACKRANIKGLRFHDLRHTAATRMVEAGVSIVVVNKILGHADLKTTMRYAHPEDSLKDAVENLANFNSNRTQNRTQAETSV